MLASTLTTGSGRLPHGTVLDSIVIKRDGKPVAALVDARLFERIRRLQARFDGLCERIEAGYAEVPEAEGLAEIDAAVAASRAGR